MKLLILLTLLLAACGPQSKEFFDNPCKGYKAENKPTVSEEPTPEPQETPEPTPDYDGRCSEADKRQIIADHEAESLKRFAKFIRNSGRPTTAADLEVSRLNAEQTCTKLRDCSGLPLAVQIPPGMEEYHCGLLNNQNWVTVDCETKNNEE